MHHLHVDMCPHTVMRMYTLRMHNFLYVLRSCVSVEACRLWIAVWGCRMQQMPQIPYQWNAFTAFKHSAELANAVLSLSRCQFIDVYFCCFCFCFLHFFAFG